MGLFSRKGGRVLNPNSSAYTHRPGLERTGSLRASAARLDKPTADKVRRLAQPWQSRALYYYDVLGEIKYAAQFYARGLSNLELFAAEKVLGDDGRISIEPTENQDAIAQLERIQDPGGGRTNLLGSYGRLMFLTGEAYLFITIDEDGQEQWEVLSSDELRPQGGNQFLRMRAPTLGMEQYRAANDDELEPVAQGEGVAYRLWRRHPRFSEYADSTMQGVLELCEELLLLTQAVRARARSRLAGSGILIMPDEMGPPPLEPVGDENLVADPFYQDLIDAMEAPLADEGAASSVVPLLVRGPAEYADKIRHLQIVDPTQLYPETGLRRECIERIALGLDLPPEILLGLTDSNHWTAWMIDEQTWKGHLQPIAQQLSDDLSAAFFRPSLREMGIPDWQNYVIAYDAAGVVNHPNRAGDAKELYRLGVLGDTALRDANGFSEDDGPTPEEKQIWIGSYSRDPGFAVTGIPSRPTPEGIAAEESGVDLPTEGGASSDDTLKQPPAPPAQAETNEPEAALVGSNGAGAHRIMGASDLAFRRVREIAGNRLRSLARRDKETLAMLEGVRAGDIPAMLGPEKARALGAPPSRELVSGCHPFIVDTLRMWGLDAAVIEKLSDLVETHAARTLYEPNPPPLPATFHRYVEGLGAVRS